MLNVDNLSFAFGKRKILDHITLTVAPGEIVGLVAPNGTGKSTLLRNIAGLLRPSEGTVTLMGYDAFKQRRQFLRHLFFLEDAHRLYDDLTALELLTYVGRIWGGEVTAATAVQRLRMADYQGVRISRMSLGMRQHVLLAAYLVSGADLLLFDEPLNGLDPTAIARFTRVFSELRDEGKAILMSSHQLPNLAEMSDRVAFLTAGQLEIHRTADVDLRREYARIFNVEEGLM
ncbi:ABC transporter ATP-binding protein [Lacticaseibacillus kribbianus]|uniref:ABC transporter ATP-binding protein n=1 Tax=Lacticaseibacillus kribbianus TaxID=2926292 RepID=UPI001CD29939|nr:ABC transporter ATP-binding protein [Lacticaseibacillus kribbianus]